MTKGYNSFEEIDTRLKILKLQREINTESLKLHFNRAKKNFYPNQFTGGFSGIAQKVLLTFAIKKLSSLFRKSSPKEI